MTLFLSQMWVAMTQEHVALRNILRHGSDCIQFCCLQNKVSYKSRHTPNTLAETAGRMGLPKQAGNCAVGMRGCLRIFVTSRWVKGLRRIFSKTVIVVSTKMRRKESWRRLTRALDYLPLVYSTVTLHTKESSQLALYYRSVNMGMTFHFLGIQFTSSYNHKNKTDIVWSLPLPVSCWIQFLHPSSLPVLDWCEEH